MQDIIQFLMAHWMLSLAFFVVLMLIIADELQSKGSNQGLSPQALVQKINRENGVVVDIRDEAGFKSEHIIHSLSIPNDQLENKLNKLNKYKNKPLIVVDEQGRQSNSAVSLLKKRGFQTVYTLTGGLTAWKTANLPTEGEKP